MSYSKTILIGNLGRDPELKFLDDGTPLCRFSVATTERWKAKNGEKQERTEWHNIVAWGKQAEHCGEYLTKGSRVLVEGAIQSRKYTGKDGTEKIAYEIKADRVVFLTAKSERASAGSSRSAGADEAPPPDDDDEIPF